jgi:hypothetical protein
VIGTNTEPQFADTPSMAADLDNIESNDKAEYIELMTLFKVIANKYAGTDLYTELKQWAATVSCEDVKAFPLPTTLSKDSTVVTANEPGSSLTFTIVDPSSVITKGRKKKSNSNKSLKGHTSVLDQRLKQNRCSASGKLGHNKKTCEA